VKELREKIRAYDAVLDLDTMNPPTETWMMGLLKKESLT
jgi:hypothetical protein